ncbi:MAG: hypothetical protein ACYCRH_04690 [Acidiferrobacteraceae bacterium]
MIEQIDIRRLTSGSVFKLVFIGNVFSVVPLAVLASVFARLGILHLTWNGKVISGNIGLIEWPLIGVFMALLGGAVGGALLAAGLWCYSLMRPLALFYWTLSRQPERTAPLNAG